MLEVADAGRRAGCVGAGTDLVWQDGEDGEVDGDVVERHQQVLELVASVVEEPLVRRGGQHGQPSRLWGTTDRGGWSMTVCRDS